MDHRTQAFRAASHLPPVSVCLLLAVASFILLCSRTETSGDPKTVYSSGAASESVSPEDDDGASGGDEAKSISQEELRIWTWLHQAETLRKAGRSEEALGTLRRAEALAKEAATTTDLRVAIQRGLAESLGSVGRHDEASTLR